MYRFLVIILTSCFVLFLRQRFYKPALFQQQIFTMAGTTQYDTDLDLVPEDSPKSYKAGTIRDQHDMRRVGKTQELRVGGVQCAFTVRMLKCSLQRNFRLISVLGFTAVLMCTWEAILLYATLW
jgi:hypothetical protein